MAFTTIPAISAGTLHALLHIEIMRWYLLFKPLLQPCEPRLLCLFILPGQWSMPPAQFQCSHSSFGLMTSPAGVAYMGIKQIQNLSKWMVLCMWGQPQKGKQDRWNNKLASELKWEAVKDRRLLQICPCLRSGCCWSSSYCKEEEGLQACARGMDRKNWGGRNDKQKVNKMSGLLAGVSKVDGIAGYNICNWKSKRQNI